MPGRLYRLLLRLLPRRRRTRYGAGMADVFDELHREERRENGTSGVALLWMQETLGLMRFAAREHLASLFTRQRPGLTTELRWAWRSVQGRGWGAVFVILLLAATLAANAVTFSVVDSLVFRTHPYADPDRIVRLDQTAAGGGIGRVASASLLAEWQKQQDVFSSVGGYLDKTIFLQGNGPIERVRTADITIGLLDVLGAKPRWGRGFVESDLAETEGYAALISEDLARRRFGSPERAPGQRMDATGGGPLLIVGVMASDFAYPSASYKVWRALEPAGFLTRNFGGAPLVARIADGVSPDRLQALVDLRSEQVGLEAGLVSFKVTAAPAFQERSPDTRRTMLLLLFGGALCLLLIACANVTSLELAAGVRRAPARMIRVALGASRATLIRVHGMEGLVLLGAALVVGLALSVLLLRLVGVVLPDSLRLSTQNPIDLDSRVVWHAASAMAVTWLLATLLPAIAGSRAASSSPALAARTSTTSRHGVGIRQALTAFEVAIAVALIVVGLLYVRSYKTLLDVEKGFDSYGLAVISAPLPLYHFADRSERAAFTERVASELRALPGVAGVTDSSPPPDLGDSPSPLTIAIDDGTVQAEVRLGRKWVDTSYFSVTGLALLRGRYLEHGDPLTNVVVTESFARRFWRQGEAVGHTIRGPRNSSYPQPLTIVGVVSDFRAERTRMPDERDTRAYVYTLRQPAEPEVIPAAPPKQIGSGGVWDPFPDNGGASSFISLTVRMDSPVRAADVRSAVQRIDPRILVTVDLVDDLYAEQNADVLLAGQVVGGFSALAFVVAIGGLYGVLAFLVTSRTREIGIRMTLGAQRGDISRMVVTSAGRVVMVGIVVGCAAAYAVARWIEAQLFGVSPSDPTTYAIVSGVVATSALAATWFPARQAARVDPAITLRAE